MITFKYKVTVKRCKNEQTVQEFIFSVNKKKEALMKVAEINADPFRTVFATIETVAEGCDSLADRAHERVARNIRRSWNLI